jgi:spore germination protein YaaH
MTLRPFLTLLLALPALALPAAAPTLSAWLPFWDGPAYPGYQSFEANVQRLTRVYPEAYECNADGSVSRIATTRPQDLAKTVALAHAHGVKVLGQTVSWDPAIHNFDPKRVEALLADPALARRHVDALLALAQADHLDGLALDYECLAAADRDAFSAFVALLCAQAHRHGLLIGVALHAKESEPGAWGGAQAQDYAALGRVADVLQVMTYDYHWASGPPGSIAPLAWMRSVARFSASVIDPAKVELGVNVYGYHWQPAGQGIGWDQFDALNRLYGPADRDADGMELLLRTPRGQAWMPDAVTAQEKFAIARQAGLGGVHLFQLGQEDPATWAAWDHFAAKAGPSAGTRL